MSAKYFKIQEAEKCKKFQKCQNLFRNFRHFFEGKELKCQKIKVKKKTKMSETFP